MNVQRFKWSCYFMMGIVLVLLYLTACSARYPSSGGTLTPVTPPLTVTLPSATPTLLPSPVPTTATPSSTHTPAPPTITPRPTLTADERLALVREMLATNRGCELPCWWDIVPGQTDWQSVVLDDAIVFNFDVPHPTRPYDYSLNLSFDHQNGVVQSIRVMSYIYPGSKSESFPRDWHRYSLDQVLSRYGEPSQVMLELWPNPPGPDYPYSLFVFYDHLGILIRYSGSAIPGEPFRMCPELTGVDHLTLWLRPPGGGPSLLELAHLDPAELAQMLPLEKATGMDIRTFYETFREAGATACLESLAEVWPSH